MKVRILVAITLLLFSIIPAFAQSKVDSVRVVKSERKLFLLSAGTVLKEFSVSLGENPLGHKQKEGDERTPEGKYVLDYKKEDSGYFRAIHISYPNAADIESARQRGVKPGGAIMIHGQKNGFGWLAKLTQRFDWTNGCVALVDEDMEQVWTLVDIGTPIEIVP
ncbi:MAG: L,D-transpeptidase family protein [Pseudomonadota bacterium]